LYNQKELEFMQLSDREKVKFLYRCVTEDPVIVKFAKERGIEFKIVNDQGGVETWMEN
jgi:hypothetical protein